jgi:hypothetical protein
MLSLTQPLLQNHGWGAGSGAENEFGNTNDAVYHMIILLAEKHCVLPYLDPSWENNKQPC